MDAISGRSRQINWSTVVMFALGFWLSGSLILDSVIIPGLLATGMMSQETFANAGYLIFGIFNRIELICAALVLTGFLVFRHHHNLTKQQERWSIILGGVLFGLTLWTRIPLMYLLGASTLLFNQMRQLADHHGAYEQ